MSELTYKKLHVIIGAQNVDLFYYIRDVANDDINMEEVNFHLSEDAPIDPEDLIDEEPPE